MADLHGPRGNVGAVARCLFVAWLAVFTLQTADVFALVLPDGCVEALEGPQTSDTCQDNCARCVCCARALLTPIVPDTSPADEVHETSALQLVVHVRSAHPLGIFHPPETR